MNSLQTSVSSTTASPSINFSPRWLVQTVSSVTTGLSSLTFVTSTRAVTVNASKLELVVAATMRWVLLN